MKAALWGLSVAGAVAGALVLVVAGFGRRGGSSARPAVLLGDLETGYPEALNDLMDHVNITDKKSWMTGIYQKAKGAKLLHPLADIDPFTGQALDGNNYEALLRSHATKAIADQMDDAAKADMASAQQVCTTDPPKKEMPLARHKICRKTRETCFKAAEPALEQRATRPGSRRMLLHRGDGFLSFSMQTHLLHSLVASHVALLPGVLSGFLESKREGQLC
jgi:hypothetical protein